MSKASGAVLIAAGAGVAAYALIPGREAAPHIPAPFEIQQVTAPGKVEASPKTPRAPTRAAAPERATTAEPAAPRPADVVVASAQPRPARPAPVVPAPGEEPTFAPMREAAPLPENTFSIARALQQELRRVGCYDGKMTGTWTPATQRAMKAYMQRVNASLPTDTPDVVLLSLVRGNPATDVCSRPCPAGQAAKRDGECVPEALLTRRGIKDRPARDGKEPAPAITGWETTATATARSLPVPPPEGERMGLSGPRGDAAGPGGPAVVPGDTAPTPSATPPPRREAREASRHRSWHRSKPDWRRKVFEF
ncbi:MAG TPA: hypothetical protein VG900_18540 [Hyphomicrobiaceae bacterium]|nr:hypothetical protein [Hyphomicrobiaceae bacterium]